MGLSRPSYAMGRAATSMMDNAVAVREYQIMRNRLLYKKNAAHIGEMIQKEGGIKNICDSIERFQ